MTTRRAATSGLPRGRPYGLAIGLAALAALLWACRGAPLGTPATDDYTFLAALRFGRPLDWLGPMGAPYYWRPIGRQLYFSLFGPTMVTAPWIVATFHAAILVLLFVVVERIARRRFEPPVAAMIAAFPLTTEAARVLLAWPSGGQQLLALLGAALSIHEALAGRRVTATIAVLAALLCHESAAVALGALPLVAWLRTRRLRPVLEWVGITVALAAVVALGHSAARARGMILPSDAHGVYSWARLSEALRLGLGAALNLEDLPRATAWALMATYAAIAVAAFVLLVGRARRTRVAAGAPALLGGAAWFVVGIAPLAIILPDWNAWRAILPGVGFGLAALGLMGIASPWLAGGFFAVHLVGLLAATPAPSVVTALPPATVSHASFVRLVRIQRTVESTRRALTLRFPVLPGGAMVRYWLIPGLTEVGFEGPRAVQVWYGDSTLRWEPFAGVAGMREPVDALVEYSALKALPARVIEPQALELFSQAIDAMGVGNAAQADDLLAASMNAQPTVSEPLYASLAHNRARMAIALGHFERADSFNALDVRWAGPSGRAFAVRARIAAARGDLTGAERALIQSLTLEPGNPDAVELARQLGFIPPETTAAAGR